MKKDKPDIRFESPANRLIGPLVDEEKQKQIIQKWIAEDHEKLEALCVHFGIQPGPSQWYLLALTLARQSYPTAQKRGRKKEWSNLLGAILVVEIDRLKAAQQIATDKEAAAELAAQEPWKSFMAGRKWTTKNFSEPGEVLRQTCSDYRGSRVHTMIQDTFQAHEAEGRLSEWEQLLQSLMREPADFPK